MGLVAGQQVYNEQLVSWMGRSLRESPGGVNRSHLASANSELAVVEEGSTQARWHPPVDYTGGGPYKGKMTAVPPALALVLYNSVFLCVSLTPSKLLMLCWCTG